MKNNRMERVSIKIVEAQKYVRSLIHLILQEQDSSSNAKDGQMSLFLYVGNYLRNMSANDYVALLYINHKIKKNATKP